MGINLSYLTYSNAKKNRDISNNSLMVSGSFGLTPKWMWGFQLVMTSKTKELPIPTFELKETWIVGS